MSEVLAQLEKKGGNGFDFGIDIGHCNIYGVNLSPSYNVDLTTQSTTNLNAGQFQILFINSKSKSSLYMRYNANSGTHGSGFVVLSLDGGNITTLFNGSLWSNASNDTEVDISGHDFLIGMAASDSAGKFKWRIA